MSLDVTSSCEKASTEEHPTNDTVEGQINLASGEMDEAFWILRQTTYQLVQDFVHLQRKFDRSIDQILVQRPGKQCEITASGIQSSLCPKLPLASNRLSFGLQWE